MAVLPCRDHMVGSINYFIAKLGIFESVSSPTSGGENEKRAMKTKMVIS